LVAAPAVPYAPWSQIPAELDPTHSDVVEPFSRGAELAAQAGFDAVLVHMGHGYLVASFLSPLTNRRTDPYGGPLDRRMAFPLRVFEAVRSAWPEDRAAGVALLSTDRVRGGFDVDEAVSVAAALRAH